MWPQGCWGVLLLVKVLILVVDWLLLLLRMNHPAAIIVLLRHEVVHNFVYGFFLGGVVNSVMILTPWVEFWCKSL